MSRHGPRSNLVRSRLGLSRRQDGVTLIELLVVLAILGLLAGLIAPQVTGYLGRAKQQTAQVQIDRLNDVLELYRLDTGQYPTAANGLDALLRQPAKAENWQGPYVDQAEALEDPWGKRFRYRRPGKTGAFDIFSLGADGKRGGEGEDSDVTR